jgi:hypothetical protein
MDDTLAGVSHLIAGNVEFLAVSGESGKLGGRDWVWGLVIGGDVMIGGGDGKFGVAHCAVIAAEGFKGLG